MRIRTIKPEFYRSDDIDALDWDARLVFIGLWSYVDDNGVGLDRVPNICADLFAGDMSRDALDILARVSTSLDQLSEANLITRYEVDGKQFFHITNWARHQRIDKPNKERYPLPPAVMETPANDSRLSRETPAPGTEEQRNRGTEELVKISSRQAVTYPDSFEAFWSAYPRKAGKAAALKAWRKAVKSTDARVIIAGAHQFRTDPNREDAFTPHPATWLNAGRWDDDPLPSRAKATTDSRIAENAARFEGRFDAAGNLVQGVLA